MNLSMLKIKMENLEFEDHSPNFNFDQDEITTKEYIDNMIIEIEERNKRKINSINKTKKKIMDALRMDNLNKLKFDKKFTKENN